MRMLMSRRQSHTSFLQAQHQPLDTVYDYSSAGYSELRRHALQKYFGPDVDAAMTAHTQRLEQYGFVVENIDHKKGTVDPNLYNWSPFELEVWQTIAKLWNIQNPMQAVLSPKQQYVQNLFIHGLTGSGKTHTVESVCKQLGIPIIRVDGAQIMSRWMGDDAKAIVALPSIVEPLAPAVLLFDEFEALAEKPSQENNMNNLHAALVKLLGKSEAMPMVWAIAITNSNPDVFSPQMQGRFKYLKAPPLQGRALTNVFCNMLNKHGYFVGRGYPVTVDSLSYLPEQLERLKRSVTSDPTGLRNLDRFIARVAGERKDVHFETALYDISNPDCQLWIQSKKEHPTASEASDAEWDADNENDNGRCVSVWCVCESFKWGCLWSHAAWCDVTCLKSCVRGVACVFRVHVCVYVHTNLSIAQEIIPAQYMERT
jgi:hypothetical protein